METFGGWLAHYEKLLAPLGPRRRTAFAALCAERALPPGFDALKIAGFDPKPFREALGLAWEFASGLRVTKTRPVRVGKNLVAQCRSMIDAAPYDLRQAALAVMAALAARESSVRAASAAAYALDASCTRRGIRIAEHYDPTFAHLLPEIAREYRAHVAAVELLVEASEQGIRRAVFAELLPG